MLFKMFIIAASGVFVTTLLGVDAIAWSRQAPRSAKRRL